VLPSRLKDHQVSVAAIDERVDENKGIAEYHNHSCGHRDRNTCRRNHRPFPRESRQLPPQDHDQYEQRSHQERDAGCCLRSLSAVFARFLQC
jgi:hypothetical protein